MFRYIKLGLHNYFIEFIIDCQYASVSFCVTLVSVEVDKITLDIAKIHVLSERFLAPLPHDPKSRKIMLDTKNRSSPLNNLLFTHNK